MPFAFEKLVVYQKSVDYAEAVFVATQNFPRGYGFLVDQLIRAAPSIRAERRRYAGRQFAIRRPCVFLRLFLACGHEGWGFDRRPSSNRHIESSSGGSFF